jgi:SHS2 domain-containing protein
MPFQELDHTADVLIRVNAPDIPSLFTEAATAMFTLITSNRNDGGIVRVVSLEGESNEDLLYDFLAELLFIAEVDRLIFSAVTVEISENSLHAVARGEVFEPARHAGAMEIKGISYSGMKIQEGKDGYQVDILFDV